MNRFFFILSFLFCCAISTAQDSTVVHEDPPKVSGIKFSEEDIQIDAASIEPKHFDKNFKKKYTGSEFIYEYKTPEKNWWDLFMEWVAKLFSNFFHFESAQTSLNFVVILFRVIAILVVIIVVYFIAKNISKQEGRWIFGKSDKKTIFYSDAEKNIHLLDFEKLIKESIENGEKRAAIRYYYLWLLKVMAQHHFIEWDIEKTNSDYLYELQQTAHKEEFTYLSYLYNYIWYGEFEIDDIKFSNTENRFKQALKTFGNG